MHNRNTQPSNKELAAAALALTAAASLVGASAIYAANNSSMEHNPDIAPAVEPSEAPDTQFGSHERITPAVEPTPAITPTTLPTLSPNKQITLASAEEPVPTSTPTPAPRPTQTQPVVEKPTDTDIGILPIPDFTPRPEVTPTPEIIVPTPDTDTPTVDIEEPEPKPEYTPVEKMDLHPELLSVPEAVSEIMKRRAVHIPAIGCSGFTIENPAGRVIGIETAQHCRLLGKDGNFFIDKEGNAKVNLFGSVQAMTGDSLMDMQSVATIDKFILHSPENMARDYALGIAEGSTAEEVFEAVEQSHLTIEEVQALEKGSVIYNAGYPIDQPDGDGTIRRQEFAMSVLGTTNWTVSNGLSVNLLIAAVPISKDGAECSWGNSGSEAFILGEDGKPRIIGTASAFNDFGHLYNKDTPFAGESVKAFAEETFGVKLDGYGALCGFAYETPLPEGDIVIADVETAELPALHTEEEYAAAISEARRQFFIPKFQRKYIDGLVMIPNEDGTATWIDKPAFNHDDATGITTILWHDAENPDNHLSHQTIDFPYQLYITDRDEVDGVDLKELTGAVAELDGQNAFGDEAGQVFSQRVEFSEDFASRKVYSMSFNYKTGTMETYEVNLKGGK